MAFTFNTFYSRVIFALLCHSAVPKRFQYSYTSDSVTCFPATSSPDRDDLCGHPCSHHMLKLCCAHALGERASASPCVSAALWFPCPVTKQNWGCASWAPLCLCAPRRSQPSSWVDTSDTQTEDGRETTVQKMCQERKPRRDCSATLSQPCRLEKGLGRQ